MNKTGYETALLHKEKAILVGIELFQKEPFPLEESLEELKRLAETAGAQVLETTYQKRDKPDPGFFIGKGKTEELKNLVALSGANLIIFDHELSPSQESNLEETLNVKVIDRTELILDIFAQHAHTKEGKIQVELAQAEFSLTRLTGHGVLLSRLGGGIGTRGPGETKLEVDRRRIRKRISLLKKEIKQLQMERGLRREKRKSTKIKTAVLIGYTNSGKSTVLNALAKSDVLVEDKLFATLDPTTRQIYLPQKNKNILLTDTVGFIQKLPHQLVDAFKATLEEVSEADLLLHIVDVSHPYFEDQISAVYTVLEELGCITKPMITVFNKKDKVKEKNLKTLLEKFDPAVAISAMHKDGLDKLSTAIATLI
ncbi:MAG: GTPase HflX [Candidatus Saganbacteria bacterium]|nr:GTPase HflX [Candidatus Saganbacteria bacterium]